MKELKDTVNATFGKKIRVRACGILVTEKGLLLVNMGGLNASNNYWLPPGGGVEFGETMQLALQREFREETGIQISVGKLLRIHQYIKNPLHAIEFFFEVKYRSGKPKMGTDPELPPNNQMLKEMKFLTVDELNQMAMEDKHPIIRNLDSFTELVQPDWNLTTEI